MEDRRKKKKKKKKKKEKKSKRVHRRNLDTHKPRRRVSFPSTR